MRTQTLLAVFLIGLIAVAQAAKEDVNFIKSLKRKSYGRTLMETVQVELKTQGNSVERVLVLLQQLKAQNIKEQKADAADNAAKLAKRISELKVAIKADSNLIIVNNETIVHKKLYIDAQQKVLAQKRAALHDIREERNVSIARFEKAFNGLSNQLITLASALVKIRELQNGASFAQVSSQIQDIRFEHPKYQSMINVLAQLLSTNIVSDQKLVKIIINIITKLQAELRHELELLVEAHKVHLHDLAATEKRVKLAIRTAKYNISTNKAIVANLERDNVNAQLRIVKNSQRLSDSQKQLVDVNTLALNRQKAFVAETQRRRDELVLIKKVIVIFQTRFSDDVKAVVSDF